MKVKWCGDLRLFPIKRGVIKIRNKMYAINIARNTTTEDDAIHGIITSENQGKIIDVKETNTTLKIKAEFQPLIRKRVKKSVMLKMILNNINMNKESMKRVLSKMLYYNFNTEDLKKMTKTDIRFERPKPFEDSWYGEKIYLKMKKGKYYEI